MVARSLLETTYCGISNVSVVLTTVVRPRMVHEAAETIYKAITKTQGGHLRQHYAKGKKIS